MSRSRVLIVDQGTLQDALEFHMSIASILPPEIIGAIVSEALPKKGVRHRIPLQVVFSHVCRHWREVTIGTPLLWANIDVYSDNSMKWLPSYLDRSKPCLLNVRIDTYDDEKRAAAVLASYALIFQLLADHFERVQYFFWFAHSESFISVLCRQHFKDIAAPALERFCTLASKNPVPWMVQVPMLPSIFAGCAPRLSLVDLEVTQLLPPLQNVTTLILGHMGLLKIRFAEIESSAPNLMHLSISRVGFAQGQPTPLIFNSLRSLKLICDPAFIIEFFDDLEAPQLESLWFGCSRYITLQPLLSRGKFLGKFPLLRYLTLQNHDYPSLGAFALEFPSVTHLHLLYPHGGGRGLTSMIQPDHSEPILWPHLHTLAIQTVHDAYSSNSDSAVPGNFIVQCRNLISYRRQMNNGLKTLLFDCDLFKIAANGPLLNVVGTTLATISRDNYQEYWWNLFEDNTLHILQ